MTEPASSPESSAPHEQSGGYADPPPSGQQYGAPEYGAPQYGAPMGNPPAYSAPPPGMAGQPGPYSDIVGRQLTSDETTWSMLGHLGGIVLGFLAPLIVMLTKGNESPYTRRQAVEALNFQITLIIGWVVAIVLSFVLIGLILFPILWIGDIVFCIIAGIAANKGEDYKYPFTLRLVK